MKHNEPLKEETLVDGLTIRLLKEDELESVARFWTVDIGIPVEVRLFKRWFIVDPEAFQIVVDKTNRIIASATVVKQTEGLFVLGYMSVAKDYRGKGIGRMLLQRMVQRASLANYVLSANGSKLSMFEEKGFKREEVGGALAYIGKFTNQLEEIPPKGDDMEMIKATVGDAIVSEIGEYDRMVNGFARNVPILIFDDPTSIVLVVKQRGKVVGYGRIQPYVHNGAWLGPIYADDSAAARYLIDSLLRSYADKKCTIIFGIISERGQPFANSLGLKFIERLTRCTLKNGSLEFPPSKLDKVYVFDDPGLAYL